MNKQYLVIIIILIMGLTSLYFISINSDVVGSASISVNKYIFSSPEGFVLDYSKSNEVALHSSSEENLSMYVTIIDDSNYFPSFLDWLENNSDYTILSKGSIKVNDIDVDTVYNRHKLNNNLSNNCSIFYFNKYGTNFKLEITGFNYDTDRNKTMNFLIDVVTSLKPDYKII